MSPYNLILSSFIGSLLFLLGMLFGFFYLANGHLAKKRRGGLDYVPVVIIVPVVFVLSVVLYMVIG